MKSGRPREIDFESMSREQLVQRLLIIRAQWRDRATRKRIRDATKALAARQVVSGARTPN